MQALKQEYIPEPIESPYPSILYEAYRKERSQLFIGMGSVVDINVCRNKIAELDNKYDRIALFVSKIIQ